MTRVELCNVFCRIQTGAGAQVHNASVYAVVLHELGDMLDELSRSVMGEWRVLQEKVVRVFGSVQHFVVIDVQFFKPGCNAFVFQLINDVEIPYNAE
jgi:hypothetical protein